jgi:hypothetical protein
MGARAAPGVLRVHVGEGTFGDGVRATHLPADGCRLRGFRRSVRLRRAERRGAREGGGRAGLSPRANSRPWYRDLHVPSDRLLSLERLHLREDGERLDVLPSSRRAGAAAPDAVGLRTCRADGVDGRPVRSVARTRHGEVAARDRLRYGFRVSLLPDAPRRAAGVSCLVALAVFGGAGLLGCGGDNAAPPACDETVDQLLSKAGVEAPRRHDCGSVAYGSSEVAAALSCFTTAQAAGQAVEVTVNNCIDCIDASTFVGTVSGKTYRVEIVVDPYGVDTRATSVATCSQIVVSDVGAVTCTSATSLYTCHAPRR